MSEEFCVLHLWELLICLFISFVGAGVLTMKILLCDLFMFTLLRLLKLKWHHLWLAQSNSHYFFYFSDGTLRVTILLVASLVLSHHVTLRLTLPLICTQHR